MQSDRFRLSDSPFGSRERANLLYSRGLRPKRAWIHQAATRFAVLALAISVKLYALFVLLWGFLCTDPVDGPSDLRLLRDRYCIDSR